jgi:hypothetical protein
MRIFLAAVLVLLPWSETLHGEPLVQKGMYPLGNQSLERLPEMKNSPDLEFLGTSIPGFTDPWNPAGSVVLMGMRRPAFCMSQGGASLPCFGDPQTGTSPLTGGTLNLDSVDNTSEHARPKLLPDRMSLMERSLWGENGILRSVGIASPLTPEVRKSELGIRRTMLTIHQVGGFVTLGLMGTAAYFGQKYLDNSLPGDRRTHQTLVTATIASYSLTALMAILSPPPLIRREETSTITIHKTLAWIHVAGMIITPIIGSMIRKRSGHFSYDDLATAHFHQVAAYITLGVFTASMIIITF